MVISEMRKAALLAAVMYSKFTWQMHMSRGQREREKEKQKAA